MTPTATDILRCGRGGRMARFSLSLAVLAGGVTTVVLHHERPAPTVSAPLQPRPASLTVSRSLWRKLLPAVSPRPLTHKARHHASTVVVPHDLNRWQRWLDVTGYCATGNPTASGVMPQLGMAATLDRSIPFGTTLLLPGVGRLVVTDRIGWGSDVDIYMGAGASCERRASTWGRRRLLVTGVTS